MDALSILGIIVAVLTNAGAFCIFVSRLLLRKIGEYQADAEAENALLPDARISCRDPHAADGSDE